MKSKQLYLTLLTAVLLLGGVSAQQKTNLPSDVKGVTEDWFNQASVYVSKMEYDLGRHTTAYGFQGFNRKNKLAFTISSKGYSVSNIRFKPNELNWQVDFQLAGMDANKLVPYLEQSNKLSFRSDKTVVEYINDESGLRQNFIIHQKPSTADRLRVDLNLATELDARIENGKKLLFHTKGNTRDVKLVYDDLKVWDANGRLLSAQMELESNQLAIIVDDRNAQYPVTIDPLNHSAEWETSADGVLPGLLINLQLQVDAIYGYSVAGLGDVNGDGFDDVAVGAPGAIDVIAGPINVAAAGAVFVYFGSAAGLPVAPSKVLRSTTPIANALFGFSIAGGNVIGNSRNDIIVSAPGEEYTATVGGFPGTADVVAGKVYVFRGEDLSAAGNPSPFLDLYLDGSTFFSNGVLGVIAANVSINALHGFSVAATEDMNGDGLGEVIVGAPGYAAPSLIPLLPVRTGAAFVYYSDDLLTNTPTQLTPPTATLLGIPLLPEGLLFGFSVDGLGDYNQDGEPDVIVGAPAGVNLVPPTNLLGGSAYIFTGNGSGVNTTHFAHLRATPSLIGTIANLFGYSVRGVRNANGSRNGNVLVSAPVGGVLSNVLGGLRLDAGTVNVYTSTAAAPNPFGEIPDQVINSPRGNFLLSILAGQDLEVSALFGASMDNMLDVNCDGINDIIVGEPLSTGVGLINTNAVGGAVFIFLGRPDGTYNTNVFWNLYNNTDFPVGINAASLLGYSVAGGRHVKGSALGVRAIVGAPGAALDFSTGLLNLGNTLGTLFDFAVGDNGLGKAYAYAFDNCGLRFNPDFNVTWVNVPVPGDVSINDKKPAGTTYGTPVPDGSFPAGTSITMNPDGTYSFVSPVPGVYEYLVPSCIPGQPDPCPLVRLTITVLNANITTNPPVANTDLGTTKEGNPVTLKSLANDRCSETGCSLNPGSVVILDPPSNGTTSINPATGDITYTPNPGFTGRDTLVYQVCDNGAPPQCDFATQIITVYDDNGLNTTGAADDYAYTQQSTPVSGNVKTNDTDPEGNNQTVTTQNTTISGKGTLNLAADGNYTFTPAAGFSGPVEFEYQTCDDGVPQECAFATLYILVRPQASLPVTLVDFSARQKNQAVEVRWTTEQEVNMSHYEVLRSRDGVNFDVIGVVMAIGSTSTLQYQFMDLNPAKGNNYYRLRMVDNDVKHRYSSIALVKLIDENSLFVSVAPNPIQSDYRIRLVGFSKGNYRIELINAMGQVQSSKRIMINEYDHVENMTRESKLSSGMYWISVIDEKSNTRVKQIGVIVKNE